MFGSGGRNGRVNAVVHTDGRRASLRFIPDIPSCKSQEVHGIGDGGAMEKLGVPVHFGADPDETGFQGRMTDGVE